MIILSRLNGKQFALNADLIEKIEATPDTLVTLIDGSIYVVADSVPDVIDSVIGFRADIVARADHGESNSRSVHLHVVDSSPDVASGEVADQSKDGEVV